jgi:cellobiose dehydrogenase (acceptor)
VPVDPATIPCVADTRLAVLPSVLAQNNAPVTFTDAASGIIFNSWGIPNGGAQTKGGFTFGVALPENALTTDASEFIGYLVCRASQHLHHRC